MFVTPLRRWLRQISGSFRRGRRAVPYPCPLRAKPQLENLEDRTLPAVVSWINPASGAWNVASNWSTGHVPGVGDDVVINPANITVTHSTGTDTINSLTSSATLSFTGGSLNLATTSTLNNELDLTGGTVSGKGNLVLNGLFSWTGGS